MVKQRVYLLQRRRIKIGDADAVPVQQPANAALGLVLWNEDARRGMTTETLADAALELYLPSAGIDRDDVAELAAVAKVIVPAVTPVRQRNPQTRKLEHVGVRLDFGALADELGSIVQVDGNTIEVPNARALAAWSAAKAVERGDVQLVPCPNCDRYWFGKRLGDLCDRPVPGKAITCEQQGAFARMRERSDWPQLYRAMYARVTRGSLPRPAFLLWSAAMRPAVTDTPVEFDEWVGRRNDEPDDPRVVEARDFLDERYWALRVAREEAAQKEGGA